MELGFTLMSEEHGPKELVRLARQAEDGGFDFLVQSDHFHPWVPEQQHSPYAWSVLGAVAAVTERVKLATFVTCPTVRYHPAVIAQKAATMALLSDDRFTLSLGAGERLNEHVVGRGWPSADIRHQMLGEAIAIIRALWGGGYQSYRGHYFQLEDGRVFDLPDQPIRLAIAASGPESLRLAIEHGDELVATDPDGELVGGFRDARGSDAPATCQVPVCVSADRQAAIDTAHRMFRWSALGWKVMSELPNPVNFAAASEYVRPDDVADRIACGDNVDDIVEAVRPYVEAGFDRVAFVQIGDDQQAFFDLWERELRDRLTREFSGPALVAATAAN
jgi:G6PDH family F420-dependent oxidoreductase